MVEEMGSLRSAGFVDPGWEHGIAQDEKKKKVRCNYCAKIVSGGIYRLKQHLARLSGEVTYCDKAPEEVFLKMRENLEGGRFGKKPRQIEYDEQAYLNFQSNDDVEEEEEQTGYRSKGKQLMGAKGLVINLAPLRSLGYVDPGWEHGVAQDERKKKVKCNYCEKIVSGGINRFKQHLARIPGEVAPCKNAPEEVYQKIKENMKWHRTGRRHRRPDSKEISAFYMHSDNEEEEEEQEEDAHVSNERPLLGDKRSGNDLRRTFKGTSSGSGSEQIMKRPRLDTIVLKTPKSQMAASSKQVKLGSSKKSRKEVISSICKFFYHAGVPSHAANSPYFHKMLELVGQYGHDFVGPSCRMISGRFLQDEIVTIKNNLVEYKASWAVTGGSILADSWKDTQGRTLINFLVSCPRGIYFVSSVDATEVVEDATNLFELLDKVVEEMGEENVVQELLRPCVTQCASSFATLQSLSDHKIGLKRMFQSNKWLSLRLSKSDEGREVEKIVQNATFWKKMQYVRKSVDPIMEVLQKITNDESLSMPYIYNDMYRAKLAIKSNHDDDVRKYGHFWSVIDNCWNSLFHHPLYLAANFLNPSYRYRPDFVAHPDVVRGLNSCLVRLEPDNGRRISASLQISEFSSAKADFGTDLAISTRSELNPAAWWQQHGINCLELQRIAVRILSQTCSSFGCEHSWSIYDLIHRQRRNHLAQKRLNDLSYVHYNLRLRERQIRRRSNDSVSLDSVLQESLLHDWIVNAERTALPQDEEILYHEVEPADACETDMIEYEDGNAESRKGSLEMLTLGEAEPLNVNPHSNVGTATDDDDDDGDDLNFLDDDLSD
ncbi:hypothetical protein RHSIM_Rhsim04G0165800 [Rhododendron simsii]|uniref:BED-type domain-containing protein n=1 Tax=Rhododendron simsii TaxID=118357 RepID=A0A834LSA7_RHOSS|nr:hypothetical protein RHSIM_Rhsim04G0165800 [Rhododendron simsii]